MAAFPKGCYGNGLRMDGAGLQRANHFSFLLRRRITRIDRDDTGHGQLILRAAPLEWWAETARGVAGKTSVAPNEALPSNRPEYAQQNRAAPRAREQAG